MDGQAKGSLCGIWLRAKSAGTRRMLLFWLREVTVTSSIFNNAMGCNVTATHRAYKRGAAFANPCYTQIHPTCIPVSGDHQSKLTLMSESLRNDDVCGCQKCDVAEKIEKESCILVMLQMRSGIIIWSENVKLPKSCASRCSLQKFQEVCDEAEELFVRLGFYLDFADAINRMGESTVNVMIIFLTCMKRLPARTLSKSHDEPAVQYTMGGLWVDYNLMGNIPGLFVIGEANFLNMEPTASELVLWYKVWQMAICPAAHNRAIPC